MGAAQAVYRIGDMMDGVTERVVMLMVGGAALVAVVALLTGADLAELMTIAIAFACGGALPSPFFKREG